MTSGTARPSNGVKPKDAAIIINPQDQIKEWGQQAEAMFGWTAGEVKDKRLCDLILPPDVCDHYLKNTAKFLKDYFSKFLYLELSAIDKAERHFPVELTVTASGQRHELTVIIHDVSAIKQAEATRGLLAAIVESSEDTIISTTQDGTITSWNKKAEEVFGYSISEAVGKNIYMLIPPELEEEQHQIFLRVQQGEKIAHYETLYLCKDARAIDVNITVSPIRNTGGQITGASIIAQDITAKKIVEADIQSYLEELKRSNQDLSEFSHIASHDLKEPLRGLSTLSSFLLEDYKDKLDPAGVGQLNKLVDLCQRMDRLINNLLYFSELGNARFSVKTCDPNEMIAEVQKMMGALLKEKNARIIIASPMPLVTCDGTRITEVFRNLITNAVKYNDKKEPLVEVGFLKSVDTPLGREENVFYVKDNGVGIAPQNQNAIFTMFKRFQSPDKKSSGVGLTFVKTIIERHKGRIWLESEPGKGSTFYFTVSRKKSD